VILQLILSEISLYSVESHSVVSAKGQFAKIGI